MSRTISIEEGQKELISPTINELLADEYQPLADYHWYFMRVNYNRSEQFYNDLKDQKKGFLLWLPFQKKIKYKDGKKFESLDAIFKSNIFIYSTREQAFSLTHHSKEGYPYVDFAYDHTVQNEFGRDHVMTIPFSEMREFIKAERVHHPWAHVVKEEQIHFRPGGMVKVTGGAFEGVVGRVARVYGQTRVVISIKGLLKYATAYISPKNMIPYDEEVAHEKADKAAHSPVKQFEESKARLVAKIKRKRIKKQNNKGKEL